MNNKEIVSMDKFTADFTKDNVNELRLLKQQLDNMDGMTEELSEYANSYSQYGIKVFLYKDDDYFKIIADEKGTTVTYETEDGPVFSSKVAGILTELQRNTFYYYIVFSFVDNTTGNIKHYRLNTKEDAERNTKLIEDIKVGRTCKVCGANMTYNYLRDYIKVVDKEGVYLGEIYSNEISNDWERVKDGECPMCNEWPTGINGVCTRYGWLIENPFFDEDDTVANLVNQGWTEHDRQKLKEKFNFSDFEADEYIKAIKLYRAN